MYSKNELVHAASIIRQIAREHDMSEYQIREDMIKALNIGRSNPDPEVRAKWDGFHCEGDGQALEAFIIWVASMVERERQEYKQPR